MWPATATTDGHLHVAADSSIDLQSVKAVLAAAVSRWHWYCTNAVVVPRSCSVLSVPAVISSSISEHGAWHALHAEGGPTAHHAACGCGCNCAIVGVAVYNGQAHFVDGQPALQWRYLELHGLGAETPSAFSSHCMNTLAHGTHCTSVCLCTVFPAPVTLMLDWQCCSLLRVGKVYYTSSLIGCDVTSNTVRHCC